MELFSFCLAVFFVYLCLYSLVNRIYKCIEHCATARSYGQFIVTTDKAEKTE